MAGDDMRKLEAGVHIVSGTPGRVFDMIKRRSLRTRQIKTLVLDEADEMLNKGFREQIYDIYRCAGGSAPSPGMHPAMAVSKATMPYMRPKSQGMRLI